MPTSVCITEVISRRPPAGPNAMRAAIPENQGGVTAQKQRLFGAMGWRILAPG